MTMLVPLVHRVNRQGDVIVAWAKGWRYPPAGLGPALERTRNRFRAKKTRSQEVPEIAAGSPLPGARWGRRFPFRLKRSCFFRNQYKVMRQVKAGDLGQLIGYLVNMKPFDLCTFFRFPDGRIA